MRGLFIALSIEFKKMVKSKIFIGSIIVFLFIGIMIGLLMFVIMHPEYLSRSAILETKSNFIETVNWASFFNMLLQLILTLGSIAFGIIASWVFGREYADRTIKDLLALPVSRTEIVIAKFAVIILWNIILTLLFYCISLIMGFAIHLPEWSSLLFRANLKFFWGGAFLTLLLITPVAYLASLSRGYILPIVYIVLIMVFTQLVFVSAPSYAGYFPWALPAIFAGITEEMNSTLDFSGYLIYFFLIILGFLTTLFYWNYADQH